MGEEDDERDEGEGGLVWFFLNLFDPVFQQ